jgi:hypothetical protein
MSGLGASLTSDDWGGKDLKRSSAFFRYPDATRAACLVRLLERPKLALARTLASCSVQGL